MAKKKEVRLNKIPLGTFLDVLLDLYNEGLDYIDIVGTPDDVQDTIGVLFTKEYMSKGMRDKFEKFEDETVHEEQEDEKIIKKDIDFSEGDDLNQII